MKKEWILEDKNTSEKSLVKRLLQSRGLKTEEEINLEHFIDMCNAVKATNPVAPPTLLISRSTYEQHKDWINKLDADVHIIKETAVLKDDDNIWIVPYGWKNGRYYD